MKAKYIAIITTLITAITSVVLFCLQKKDNHGNDCTEALNLQTAKYSDTFINKGVNYINFIHNGSFGNPKFKTEDVTFSFSPEKESYFDARYDGVQIAMRKILLSYNLKINVDGFITLQDRAHSFSKSMVVDTLFDNMFCAMYDSIIGYDCSEQKFLCKTRIGYNAEAFILPKDLLSLINEEIEKIPAIEKFKNAPLNFNLNFTEITNTLMLNGDFKTKYCNIVQSNWEKYRIFYPELGGSDCELLFESGDYNINPIGVVIISAIAEKYYNFIRLRPEKSYQIVCSGFSDGQTVQSGGIDYGGNAFWSINGDTLSYVNDEIGKPIGSRTEPYYKGNYQLAYIRAFNGIEQLHNSILLFSRKSQPIKLSFSYVGLKPKNDGINIKGDRKIEFILHEI
ncbi:MAG: hypothetical protein GC192_24320 [Bacteroidetes bacterium]|nr:hypothetical protein [Bacteroidota bacterium]